MNNQKNTSSRSWFCVLNNPQTQFGDMTPNDMVHAAVQLWVQDKSYRTCAINYEIGENKTPHMHMVLEDPTKVRFSAIKKLFPTIHIEPTRGNKEQAEDYINKRGKFHEKNTTLIVPPVYHGDIKAQQGKRSDLIMIEDFINEGLTPSRIMDMDIRFRRYESMIRKAYFSKRFKETPSFRNIVVYWHVGESGSGKSYSQIELLDKYGAENVYILTDYDNGGLDMYEGQKILFMDEFKGNMRFSTLLQILDKYRCQIHCRYCNIYALWSEVHITSIYPPEEAYKFMVEKQNQQIDTVKQLLRRISYICYHYKENDNYCCYTQNSKEYKSYEQLIHSALSDPDGFIPLAENTPTPFDGEMQSLAAEQLQLPLTISLPT